MQEKAHTHTSLDHSGDAKGKVSIALGYCSNSVHIHSNKGHLFIVNKNREISFKIIFLLWAVWKSGHNAMESNHYAIIPLANSK